MTIHQNTASTFPGRLPPSTKTIADKISTIIKKHDPDAEIILFGSQARGDAEVDSDWDVLVLTEKDTETLGKILQKEVLYQIEIPGNMVVSLIIKDKKEWEERYSITPLYDTIQKEGILL